MSIWTCKTVSAKLCSAAALVAAALALTGCLEIGGNADGDQPKQRAPQSIRVADRQVAITGPDGYCVDKGASRETATGAFVLLGSCRAISGNPEDPRPAQPMVLTVSVAPGQGAADTAGLERLETFFASQAGHRALSRAQDADSVTLHDVTRGDDALFLHVTDAAPNGLGAVDDTYWRALFEVKGHLVTVTANGFSGRASNGRAGLGTVKALVERIRTANETGNIPTVSLRNIVNRLL
ncbi:hypothetical protein [Aliiroseovarius subalbicans]|uniref:hypothetical protein n=1 Tax=Aliiroseovarius subalbicans TaxID=2925840 RepID=UPI001F57777A|nr:hypothetical protein [Aliiroseovarius subalbicans]MCI2399499.1 hypothetical protein [Aliiroseovarius subalbicans]